MNIPALPKTIRASAFQPAETASCVSTCEPIIKYFSGYFKEPELLLALLELDTY
jgi:hypothetical protein